MSNLSFFLQFEGSRIVELIEMPTTATPEDVIDAAVRLGFAEGGRGEALVFLEDREEPADRKKSLESQGGKHKGRVVVHRCRKIEVAVQFNAETAHRTFAPVATVEQVKRWFVREIGMKPVDASEHVLQITGTTDRPDPDVHIGALASHATCSLKFTLVPRKRVEG